MKVILLRDVRGLGQVHDIKDVAQGYAHNFLLPHKYAVAATEEKLKEIEAKKAQLETERIQEEERLAANIQSLEHKRVTIVARATEKGGLFKSLTAADVSKVIKLEYGLDIPEAAIEIEHLKTVGEHQARLRSKSAQAECTVVVVAQR